MKKQKKQNLLTAIIIILVIVLAMLVGSIVYEEMINMNKQQTQNTLSPGIENKDEEDNEVEDEPVQEEIVEEEKEVEEEQQPEKVEDEKEFVGEEENTPKQEVTENLDEKAIQLVKKEWGEDDSVTFSIEKKKGDKYYVAVKHYLAA